MFVLPFNGRPCEPSKDETSGWGREMGRPIDIAEIKMSPFRYSVCTFVNNRLQYKNMVDSFVSRGFSYDDCEYLYIDNSEDNRYEAYAGINKFLTVASGIPSFRERLDFEAFWPSCGAKGGS